MKNIIILFVLYISTICTMDISSTKLTEHITVRRGTIARSIDGNLICCTLYDSRHKVYCGFWLNMDYESTPWVLKTIDDAVARKFYKSFEQEEKSRL